MKKLFAITILTAFVLLNACQKEKVAPIGYTYKESQGGVVSFFNYSNGTSFKWDFGTGDYSTERNPVYTFPVNKLYKVTLNIDGSKGFSDYVDVKTAANKGSLILWTQLPDEGKITVKLSGLDVGAITKYRASSLVPDCGTEGFVTVTRVEGNYTYEATSAKGNVWSKTIRITGGKCFSVELSK